MSTDSPGENIMTADICSQLEEMHLNGDGMQANNVDPNVSNMEPILVEVQHDCESSSLISDLLVNSMPHVIANSSGGCSENESESSSMGVGNRRGVHPSTPKPSSKRLELSQMTNEKTRAMRSPATIKRAVSLPRSTVQPSKYLTPLKQVNRTNTVTNGSYRETTTTTTTPSSARNSNSRFQSSSNFIKPQKPNSLPNVQSRSASKSQIMAHGNLSASKRSENTSLRIRSSLLSVELKSSMTASVNNPYGTAPRRRKQKSVEDLYNGKLMDSRSSSVSCDTRMATSMNFSARKQLQLSCSGVSSNCSSAWTTPTQTHMSVWPSSNTLLSAKSFSTKTATRKLHQSNSNKSQKTRIYYEQSVQTALTYSDMTKLLQGESIDAKLLKYCNAATNGDNCHQETQCSDIRDAELEHLREEVRNLSANLQREREEKALMQRELQLNTERVMSMLELARINSNGNGGGWTPTSEDDASTGTGSCSASGHDSLLMLESQIQLSGHELSERQQEIRQLRQFCRSLQSEMQRSIAAQQFLMEEKAVIEQESNEMQDFLQHEKSAMYDALRDLEADFEACKAQLANRDEDVKALREKCRFLVRLNEQRRQECLMHQTKYTALKSKSQEFILQQHSAISAGYVALSKLDTRLRSLVDELKRTYNITEQDLEDQVLQTEEQTVSLPFTPQAMNCESSVEKVNNFSSVLDLPATGDDDDGGSLSPERHRSFIAAIIGAIRNATTAHKRIPSQSQLTDNQCGSSTSSLERLKLNGNTHFQLENTDMLDSETEPFLMMDTLLEDVKLPDTHSHNMVSTALMSAKRDQCTTDMDLLNALNNEIMLNDKLSLHYLSQDIVDRQNIEMHPKNDDISLEMPHDDDNCIDAKALTEKVNGVDLLVTRLLRLIQVDNDHCIQQLIVDKNKLQQHREEMLEKIRELQEVNIKLQDDLIDATQELMLKNNELSGKPDLQNHHNEIDSKKSDTAEKMFYSLPTQQHDALNENYRKELDYEVMEVMNLLTTLQAKGQANDMKSIQEINDIEGNTNNKSLVDELSSPNRLESILNTFDTVDNLNDIDAEVQQTIMKLKENWTSLSLNTDTDDDFVDSNANANANAN